MASPRVDAELLAAYVLGVRRTALAAAEKLSADQHDRFRALVARRAARVPLQHLTGVAPFRRIELAVGPGVFVPRPETELLVEWALRWLRQLDHREALPVVVDLCAGSGAIAGALADEAPGIRVYAVESDPAALAWLRRNVAPWQVIVEAGDATKPATLSGLDGAVDLVVTNPPYIPQPQRASLPPEVVDHDPPAAVFAGPDGLAVIGPLVARMATLLRPGGAGAIEHDQSQAQPVADLLRAAGFAQIQLHLDLAGRPRFTTATRGSDSAAVAHLPA